MNDLVFYSDADLLTILREIPNETLLAAVSGESDEIQQRICEALSVQGAMLFLEDLEKFKPLFTIQRRQEAQQSLFNLVRELKATGKIKMKARKSARIVS